MSAVETPATDLTEVIGRRTGTGQKEKHMKSETPDPAGGGPAKRNQVRKYPKNLRMEDIFG